MRGKKARKGEGTKVRTLPLSTREGEGGEVKKAIAGQARNDRKVGANTINGQNKICTFIFSELRKIHW